MNTTSKMYPKTSISITTIDVKNGTPMYTRNLSKRIESLSKYTSHNNGFFNIVIIKGLHGYNCGAIGWVFNSLSWYTAGLFANSLVNPENIGFGLSLVTRVIPLLNLVSWDPKTYLNLENLSMSHNMSMPSLTLNSLFCFSPLFDSGSSIVSDAHIKLNGFEPWNNLNPNSIFNYGINWTVYILLSMEEILVIDADILDIDNERIVSKINQIIGLKNRLIKDKTFLVARLGFTQTMPEWELLSGFEVVCNKGDLYILSYSETSSLGEDLVLTRYLETEDGDKITQYQRIDLPEKMEFNPEVEPSNDIIINITENHISSPAARSEDSWDKIEDTKN